MYVCMDVYVCMYVCMTGLQSESEEAMSWMYEPYEQRRGMYVGG